MKPVKKFPTYILLIGVIIIASCSKNKSVKNDGAINRFPVANAGVDQINAYALCNITLDGSGSFDHYGTIVSSIWSKINGTGQAAITDPTSLVTTVSGLSEGIYNFRLQITDNMGNVDDDTIQIKTVNTLSGLEILYTSRWGCNDLCKDGDVYWVSSPDSNLYCNSSIPLKVSIRLDSSSAWIDVNNVNSPLPPINQFYWQIDRGYLWVFAYEGRLIGTPVTVKVKFL